MAVAPWYGWLIGLTGYMNTNYGANWCYTGSFAMYCHAAAQGIQARQPGDIDLIVEVVDSTWFKLRAALEGAARNPPGPSTTHAKIYECEFQVVPENGPAVTQLVDIDVLQSRTEFGDYSRGIVLNQHAAVLRVSPLSELRAKKQLTIARLGVGQQDLDFLNTLAG